MSDTSVQRYRWFITAPNVWSTRPKGTSHVTGTITYNGTHYSLSTSDSGITAAAHTTLKLAKSAFRQYMHSIP